MRCTAWRRSGGAERGSRCAGLETLCRNEAALSTAPFVFTPDCGGTSEHAVEFTVEGDEISVLNEDVFPLYRDFDGPAAPYFDPNPNNREDDWVNATVDFVGEQGSNCA